MRDVVLVGQIANVLDGYRIDLGRIDMGHAGVTPGRFANRPAHDLHAVVANLGGGRKNFLQRLVRQNRADKT